MSTISGDAAKENDVIRLDSFATVNEGELVEADEQTGVVKYKDRSGEIRVVTLGERAIRIMRKGR